MKQYYLPIINHSLEYSHVVLCVFVCVLVFIVIIIILI